MIWKLKNIIQETNHPFLNYFTLTYEVEDSNTQIKQYSYFMASRRKKEELVCLHKDKNYADGVLIPCYFIDPKTNLLSLIVTKQFRPALNRYVHSFPAGLVDKDEDLITASKREALEEVGAVIDKAEILCRPGPTSSGLSDELNAIVLAHVSHFDKKHLEEFEDINFRIVPFKDLEKELSEHFFALQIQIICRYLLLYFKGQY